MHHFLLKGLAGKEKHDSEIRTSVQESIIKIQRTLNVSSGKELLSLLPSCHANPITQADSASPAVGALPSVCLCRFTHCTCTSCTHTMCNTTPCLHHTRCTQTSAILCTHHTMYTPHTLHTHHTVHTPCTHVHIFLNKMWLCYPSFYCFKRYLLYTKCIRMLAWCFLISGY